MYLFQELTKLLQRLVAVGLAQSVEDKLGYANTILKMPSEIFCSIVHNDSLRKVTTNFREVLYVISFFFMN